MKDLSLDEIVARLTKVTNPIIAIDGPAGAGKTTLANRIASRYQGTSITIHMDDLYGGWEDALGPSLARVLVNQILTPVSQRKAFGYRRYDWLQRRFNEPERFAPPDLLIMEGVGSGQRACGKFLNELIWIDIDAEVGLARVLNRDGDYLLEEMSVWQMHERDHFKNENTRGRATIRLDGKFFI